MKTIVVSVSLIMCVIKSVAHADDKDVITAFILLKSYTEVGVNRLKYADLLGEVNTQINIMKKMSHNESILLT